MAVIDPNEGFPVYVVRDEAQGVYRFEVRPGGVPIVIGSRKLGGIDVDLIRAEEQAQQQQAEQAPSPQNEPPVPPSPTA